MTCSSQGRQQSCRFLSTSQERVLSGVELNQELSNRLAFTATAPLNAANSSSTVTKITLGHQSSLAPGRLGRTAAVTQAQLLQGTSAAQGSALQRRLPRATLSPRLPTQRRGRVRRWLKGLSTQHVSARQAGVRDVHRLPCQALPYRAAKP